MKLCKSFMQSSIHCWNGKQFGDIATAGNRKFLMKLRVWVRGKFLIGSSSSWLRYQLRLKDIFESKRSFQVNLNVANSKCQALNWILEELKVDHYDSTWRTALQTQNMCNLNSYHDKELKPETSRKISCETWHIQLCYFFPVECSFTINYLQFALHTWL